MIIERGTKVHIDELEELYDTLNDYLAATRNYPGWIKHIYPIRETAVEGIEQGSLFIVKLDGVIAGSIILDHEPEQAYYQAKWLVDADYKDVLIIRTLVVHPSYMSRGLAMSLMNFARQYATTRGLKSIRLDVSVDNTPAIHLYKKMGYQYIDTVDLGLPYEHLKWFQLYELPLIKRETVDQTF